MPKLAWTPILALFASHLLGHSEAFPLPRPIQERASTQRSYSLDSYLETLSQIQSTVNAAGYDSTQAYLQSLATLNNKDPSETVPEQYTSRTAMASLNYLERLSDVPVSKMVESKATSTHYLESLAHISNQDLTEALPSSCTTPNKAVASSAIANKKTTVKGSLKADVPHALFSAPSPESIPMSPERARAKLKPSASFSPDSTMPSLFAEPKKAMEKRNPIQESTPAAPSAKNTPPRPVVQSSTNVATLSDDMMRRIALAADFAMDNTWDAETIKATSPLADITTVLADITENSHVALQNGQDEVTKSLTKWVKSTQNILESSNNVEAGVKQFATDMSVSELSERIAQGFFSLGELVVTALNLVAESVSGKSLTVAAKSAQEAATEAIAGAVASVMTTVQKIGDFSVADVLQSMVELIILISRVVFKIFAGAIEIVSGKSVGQMGQALTDSFEKEAKALAATKSELSEKSLYDLVVVLGKFELEAAEAVMATATNAVRSLEVGIVGPKKATVGL